jgi:hypothetical protein
MPVMLARCQGSLTPEGAILVRIWHRERHLEYVKLLLRTGFVCRPPIYILEQQTGSWTGDGESACEECEFALSCVK